MTVTIVIELEVIDVGHNYGDVLVVAHRLLPNLPKVLVECTTIKKPGKPVCAGQSGELAFVVKDFSSISFEDITRIGSDEVGEAEKQAAVGDILHGCAECDGDAQINSKHRPSDQGALSQR